MHHYALHLRSSCDLRWGIMAWLRHLCTHRSNCASLLTHSTKVDTLLSSDATLIGPATFISVHVIQFDVKRESEQIVTVPTTRGNTRPYIPSATTSKKGSPYLESAMQDRSTPSLTQSSLGMSRVLNVSTKGSLIRVHGMRRARMYRKTDSGNMQAAGHNS